MVDSVDVPGLAGTAGAAPGPTAPEIWDGFVVPAAGPLAAAHAAIDPFVAEEILRIEACARSPRAAYTESGRRILDLPPADQAAVAVAVMQRAEWASVRREGGRGGLALYGPLVDLLSVLVRRRLPLSPEQLAALLGSNVVDFRPLLPLAEQMCADPAKREMLRPALEKHRARVSELLYREHRELKRRIGEMLAGQDALVLDPEPWTDPIAAEVQAMDEPARGRWIALLRHLRDATSTRASARWLKEARRLVGEVGADAFRGRALAWVAGVREGADTQVSRATATCCAGSSGVWRTAATRTRRACWASWLSWVRARSPAWAFGRSRR